MSKLKKLVSNVVLPVLAFGSLSISGALYVYDRGYSNASNHYRPILLEQTRCIESAEEGMALQEKIFKELIYLKNNPKNSESINRVDDLLSELGSYKQKLKSEQLKVEELQRNYAK